MICLAVSMSLSVVAHAAQTPRRTSTAPATSGWRVDTSRSEMTDELSVLLSLDAVNPASGRLIIRCRERDLNVYVSTQSILEAYGRYGTTPVRLRWGTARVETDYWDRGTDFTAAFAPTPWYVVFHLLDQPDFRIEVQPVNGLPTVITFNARGLDRHMSQLQAGCPPDTTPVNTDSLLRSVDSLMQSLDTASNDQVFMESVVDERPEVLSGPRLQYPDLLRQAGVSGRVLVQAIIDKNGRAEPASVKIIQSPNTGFNQVAEDYVLGAMFRPARVHGRPVRVLVNLPIDFSVRR
jgi:TonB family protein